jgi:hypothetical protein
MSPEVRKLTEELGVEETLNRLLGFARTAYAWKQETGEKLNTQHYIAVVSALNTEKKK